MIGLRRPLILAVPLAVALGLAVPASAQFGGFLGGILDDWFGGGDGRGCVGGCQIVESTPLIVEGMVKTQELELIAQTAHMLTQIDNMIRMRTLAGLDQSAEVGTSLRAMRAVLARVGRVPWTPSAADADYATLYPDALPAGWDAAAVEAHRAEQHLLAKAASRASKLATAEAVTGTEAWPARTAGLAAALKACEGQTCALDVAVQASLLNAEVASRTLVLQAAHARAVEGRLDDEAAAIERARQHTLINWRGLESYGGPGS